MTALPRRGRVGRLRERLGSRGLEVLGSLARLRLLNGDQIWRLHFGDGSPVTAARRARAQMQRLADLKLVIRLGRRVGGVRAGSSGFVYGLSGHGQAVLDLDGLYGGRRRRVWQTSPSFEDHVLAVSELYVGLVEAERAGKVELLAFEAEPGCWRRFSGNGGQVVALKPDAFVRLGIGDVERSVFVEVDRGTESAPTIARKCQTYLTYWRSGLEQARHEVFPAVVWLTITDRSRQRIAGVLKRLPTDAAGLFSVGLLDEATTLLLGDEAGGQS